MKDISPREKALNYGITSLEDSELLSLIIKTGKSGKSVSEVSKDILDNCKDFTGLFNYGYEELTSIEGIGKAKALEIMAVIEIYRRINSLEKISPDISLSPTKIVNWLRFKIGFSAQEEFMAVFLGPAGNIIKHEILFRGSFNHATVGIDEIIRRALRLKAAGIIVAHNHPGGVAVPSDDDIAVTRRLKMSCELLGIRLLDHIIITGSSHFSFSGEGLLC